jgi:glycosyltransferase involved in cell wall biosynthesis
MRIGIDAFPLCPHFPATGIPRSVREILRELQRIDQENDYFLYSKLDFDFPLKNPRWRKCLHPRIPYLLGSLYLKEGLKGSDCNRELDIFWTTRTHTFPFGLGSDTGRVMTVYDLVWLLYPDTMEPINRVAFKVFASSGIRQAHRIISISESTCRGLEEQLDVPRSKMKVVHLGVDPSFTPRGRNESARFIARKYGTSPDYIFTVGTVEPRKNFVTLIDALRLLHQRGRWRHQLLIAGESGWKNSGVYATVDRCGLSEREVKFLGRVPEEDLPLLYSGAALFVFPSLYEGFGLPPLEAMACGTPVIASNTSAVPEVLGEAGVLVSPQRPAEFAEAMARMTVDTGLGRALAEKGLKRARQFSWEAAARKVRGVLEEASPRARNEGRQDASESKAGLG